MDKIYIELKSIMTKKPYMSYFDKNYFENDEIFFDFIEVKKDFLKFFNKYRNNFEFIFFSDNYKSKLIKEKKWLEKNIEKKIKFITFNGDYAKDDIDMSNSIQVNSNFNNFNKSSKIKILCLNKQDCKKNYDNVILTDNWNSIDDIISFYNKYDFNNLKKRGKVM